MNHAPQPELFAGNHSGTRVATGSVTMRTWLMTLPLAISVSTSTFAVAADHCDDSCQDIGLGSCQGGKEHQDCLDSCRANEASGSGASSSSSSTVADSGRECADPDADTRSACCATRHPTGSAQVTRDMTACLCASEACGGPCADSCAGSTALASAECNTCVSGVQRSCGSDAVARCKTTSDCRAYLDCL